MNTADEYVSQLENYERLLDPITISILKKIIPRNDLECLEIGAGAGSIARWLADRISQGCVTATDVNVTLLTPGRRLHVRVLDVQSDEIGCRTWDLVHVRSVLTYLSDRTQVVRRLIAALKPGGHLLIEEPYFVDLTACDQTAPETVRHYSKALRQMVTHAGADAQFGLRVPQILTDAGLQCESQVVGFTGRAGDGGWGDFMVSRSSLESRRMVELGLLSEEAAAAAVRQLSSGIEHRIPMKMCSTWATIPVR